MIQAEIPLFTSSGEISIPPRPALRGRRALVLLIVLTVAAALLGLISAGIGQFSIPVDEVWASVLRKLSLSEIPLAPDEQRRIMQVDGALWEIRFPRVALGLIVGACLGIAGCLTQGLFGNPLAEPSIIGTSAGAALGACLVIVSGVGASTLGPVALPLGAFIGAVLSTVAVYSLARSGSQARTITLILTGIAVNAVASAVIALLMFLGNQVSRDAIVFWQLGSLNGALWRAVFTTLPFLIGGFLVAQSLAARLDLLALGEHTARHLGVRVERLRVVCVTVLALLTAAGVAFSGVIAFVGLIVPHLFRLILGPSHRTLIPASALGGALLVAGADVAARTLVPFADLPIGMLTAFIGGPVFYLLLRKGTR